MLYLILQYFFKDLFLKSLIAAYNTGIYARLAGRWKHQEQYKAKRHQVGNNRIKPPNLRNMPTVMQYYKTYFVLPNIEYN